MMRAAACSMVLALSLAGCAPPAELAPAPADAAVTADVPTDLAPVADASAAPDAAPAVDPCDLHAEVDVRLRSAVDGRVVARLPAGTALELLAVTDTARGAVDQLGVLTRVRVRATGAEGFVYVAADALRRCEDHRATAPDVSESRTVAVDGVEETWRVRFVTPSLAPAEIADGEWSCPRAFESRFDRGRAVLERVRGGVVVDRFENPCGSTDGEECARRLLIPWRVAAPRDRRVDAGRLPRVTYLDVADYDHDGRATEFAADLGELVCGHTEAVIIGITRDRPRLHVLRWADGGRMAMTSGRAGWEPVRASARGDVATWRRGDHGVTDEERMRWWPAGHGLQNEEYVAASPDEGGADETVLEAGE